MAEDNGRVGARDTCATFDQGGRESLRRLMTWERAEEHVGEHPTDTRKTSSPRHDPHRPQHGLDLAAVPRSAIRPTMTFMAGDCSWRRLFENGKGYARSARSWSTRRFNARTRRWRSRDGNIASGSSGGDAVRRRCRTPWGRAQSPPVRRYRVAESLVRVLLSQPQRFRTGYAPTTLRLVKLRHRRARGQIGTAEIAFRTNRCRENPRNENVPTKRGTRLR